MIRENLCKNKWSIVALVRDLAFRLCLPLGLYSDILLCFDRPDRESFVAGFDAATDLTANPLWRYTYHDGMVMT